MPGLSLQCLQCHAGFPQPRKARVAQLVAGQHWEACSLAGTADDLIQPGWSKWLAAMWSLEHNEDAISVSLRTLVREVPGKADEEARRNGNEALVTPLAIGN